MPDAIDETELLTQQEAWANQVAELLAETGPYSFDDYLAGARWACLWRNDLDLQFGGTRPTTRVELRDAMMAAYETSLERADGIPRYPSGVPTVRAIVAAQQALVLGFGDDGPKIANMLRETESE